MIYFLYEIWFIVMIDFCIIKAYTPLESWIKTNSKSKNY